MTKKPFPGFPKVVIRVPQYAGDLSEALRCFGENLNSGGDRLLLKLGCDPAKIPSVKEFRDSEFGQLKDQVMAKLEAAKETLLLGSAEEKMECGQRLAAEVNSLILSCFHAKKRKGAPRKYGKRDAEMWRLSRLEHFGSYAKIGLQFTPTLDRPAVFAAIKRKDAEAKYFRNLISSLKEPLGTLGITLIEAPPRRTQRSPVKNPTRN